MFALHDGVNGATSPVPLLSATRPDRPSPSADRPRLPRRPPSLRSGSRLAAAPPPPSAGLPQDPYRSVNAALDAQARPWDCPRHLVLYWSCPCRRPPPFHARPSRREPAFGAPSSARTTEPKASAYRNEPGNRPTRNYTNEFTLRAQTNPSQESRSHETNPENLL